MDITEITDEMRTIYRSIIIDNELGGDGDLAYELSRPSGGKSGLSFGVVQYDINNNANAVACLKEIGFIPSEITALQTEPNTVQLSPFNERLMSHRDIVDKWDDMQLESCLAHSMLVCTMTKAQFSDISGFMMIADYDNQLHVDMNGPLYKWLQVNSNGSLTPEIIRDWKLHFTLWGKTNPDDVERRYANVVKVCAQSA
jgi:hypothetical protein